MKEKRQIKPLFPICFIIRKWDAGHGRLDNITLTFDDGPNAHSDTTMRLLEVLKKHSVKGIFNLVGKNVAKNQEIARKIYEEGHTISNHTYAHKIPIFMNEREAFEEISQTSNAIVEAIKDTAFVCKYFRPPLLMNTKVFRIIEKKMGLEPIGLTMIPFPPDSEYSPSTGYKVIELYKKELVKTRGGIIVFHDGNERGREIDERKYLSTHSKMNRSWIPDAVDDIIEYFKDLNYSFEIDPAKA